MEQFSQIFFNLFDLILEVMGKISWPIAVLIIFYIIKKQINELLISLVSIINRVSEISFKDLRMILTNADVPSEIKTKLTDIFVYKQKIAQDLKCFIDALTKIQFRIINAHLPLPVDVSEKEIIDYAVRLCDVLEIINPEKAVIMKEFIQKFSHKYQEIGQNFFHICDAMDVLDANWREKHPRDFHELVKIRKVLLGYAQDYSI